MLRHAAVDQHRFAETATVCNNSAVLQQSEIINQLS